MLASGTVPMPKKRPARAPSMSRGGPRGYPVRAIVWRGMIDDLWRRVVQTRLPADRDGLSRLVSYRALRRLAYLRRKGQQDTVDPAAAIISAIPARLRKAHC
jgi:hypothetical protein